MSIDSKSTYYDAGGIETIDIIKAKLTTEQFHGYLLGNIIKYSTRANFKGQRADDIRKIKVYAEQLPPESSMLDSINKNVKEVLGIALRAENPEIVGRLKHIQDMLENYNGGSKS